MDVNMFNVDYEFSISRTGILEIKMMKDEKAIGNALLYLDRNDLMGLKNLIKDYFKARELD